MYDGKGGTLFVVAIAVIGFSLYAIVKTVTEWVL